MTQVWTIAEAEGRLSEIMRLASTEGPQRISAPSARGIGELDRCVIVPEAMWDKLVAAPPPIGAWLVANMPRAAEDADEIVLPDRSEPARPAPFDATG